MVQDHRPESKGRDGYLAAAHREVLFNSPFLLAVGLALLAGWLFLGKVYFFSTPFRGIVIATICYVISVGLGLIA